MNHFMWIIFSVFLQSIVKFVKKIIEYRTKINFISNKGRDLEQRIKETIENKLKFSNELILIWISDLLKGTLYLHENKVIHRDIKPA